MPSYIGFNFLTAPSKQQSQTYITMAGYSTQQLIFAIEQVFLSENAAVHRQSVKLRFPPKDHFI